MVDSARSTCEKQLRGFCGIKSAVHTGESAWYVGVSQDLFDRSTLDRLVVVDTSAAASDGVIATFDVLALPRSLPRSTEQQHNTEKHLKAWCLAPAGWADKTELSLMLTPRQSPCVGRNTR